MSSSQLAIVQIYKVQLMAIALLAKLRSLHTAAIQYPYIVITLPRIIAISSHTYVSRTVRLEPALTYLSGMENGMER